MKWLLIPCLLWSASFDKLPIRPGECEIIGAILHTLATESVFSLLWHKKEIDRLSAKIDHVHPLRFFWCIATTEAIVSDVRSVARHPLKWNRFMAESRARLERAPLMPYLSGFCREVGIDEARAVRYVRAKRWERFVHLLL